ncbi:hypothetical protein [Streptomyces sp. NPDC001292]|uniref:hypothetical protein n=1 Tax=Streptomyces sp. NPDC001292 TaxID=3364558 RepID=UPI003675D33F
MTKTRTLHWLKGTAVSCLAAVVCYWGWPARARPSSRSARNRRCHGSAQALAVRARIVLA